MSLIDTLRALAITVRNEKKKEANSSVRIGDLFIAVIDFIKGLSTGSYPMPGVDTYNITSDGKTSLRSTYPNPSIGWRVVVREDETKDNKKITYQWNGSDWIDLDQSVMPENAATKEDLLEKVSNDKLFTKKNIFFVSAGSGFWAGSVGSSPSIVQFEGFYYMELMDVVENDVIIGNKFNLKTLSSYILCFVDSNNKIIENLRVSNLEIKETSLGSFTIIAPLGTAKVGFSYNATNSDFDISETAIQIYNSIVKENSLPSASETNKGIVKITSNFGENKEVSASQELVTRFKGDILEDEFINTPFVSAGSGYWNGNVGQTPSIAQYDGFFYMTTINCKEGDVVLGNRFNLTTSSARIVCFTDSENKVVANLRVSDLTDIDTLTGKFTIKAPANTAKVGLSFLNTNASFPIEEATIILSSVKIKETLLSKSLEGLDVGVRVLSSQTDIYSRGNAPKKYNNDKKVGLIVAGQSNTRGTNAPAQYPASYIDENEQTVNYLTAENKIPNTMYCYNDPDAILTEWELGSNTWGYDSIVLSRLQHFLNDTIYHIKTAYGGTAIDPSGQQSGVGFWTPRFENIPSNKMRLLSLFEQSIRTALQNNPNTFDIKAFVWHQGESDGYPYVLAQEHYYHNLCDVIDYVRGVVDNPTLPFIFGTVPHTSANYSKIVEDAMYKVVGQDKNIHLVDMSKAQLYDNWHFTPEWSEYLGTKIYKILRDVII